MPDLDFTPFGFTPTESLVYEALLERGPSSGYRLSKALSVARANTYQALNGLVAKGAARARQETPKVFRAVAPDALLALVARGQARQLDRLERQLHERGGAGEPATVPFRGERELQELVLRTVRSPNSCRSGGSGPQTGRKPSSGWSGRHRSGSRSRSQAA
jgi:sugar-specific transcriptional regulator TrmB